MMLIFKLQHFGNDLLKVRIKLNERCDEKPRWRKIHQIYKAADQLNLLTYTE